METTKAPYQGIDLMKFLMAVVVVSIHTSLYKVIGSCYGVFQNYAVPVFFVFSAYFFFRKIPTLPPDGQWKALWKFEKRINTLYVFWILALMPFILYWWHHDYLEMPIAQTLLIFTRNYFFGSQFGASWFFGALIVGTPIIMLIDKYLRKLGG